MSSSRFWVTAGMILFMLSAVSAQGDDEARALVNKAIQATGGKEKLAKYKAAVMAEKGTYYGMGEGLPYTATMAVEWPDRSRMEVKDVFTMIVDRKKGWTKGPDGAKEMSKEEIGYHHKQNLISYMTTLVPLTDPGFMLTKLADAEVEGKKLAGVRVSRKGYPTVSFYFDKKTNLLAKADYTATPPEAMFEKTQQENHYSDYRDVDGIKVPHKMIIKRDGKKYIEAEVTEFQFKDKLDDSTFAAPGQ